MDEPDNTLSGRAAGYMHAAARLEQPMGALAEAMDDI